MTGTEGEDFAQELAAFVEEQGGTHLDLREVQFIGDGAIEALKGLHDAARIIDCNGFLRKCLQAEGVGLLLPDKKEEGQE